MLPPCSSVVAAVDSIHRGLPIIQAYYTINMT